MRMPLKRPQLIPLLVTALLLGTVCPLKPTAPILASPNTESSPSNFIVSISLSNDLAVGAYLMVVIPFYSSTITPKSCTLLNSLSTTASTCQNLNLASAAVPNPLTINTTVANQLNPNIASTLTIVVGFSGVLSKNTEYSMQILLQENLPAIGALSQSFEMYAISSTGVMLEENWNMGQVFLELRNNNQINLVSINSQITNEPGMTVSTLLLDVTIGVACPTPLSTFLFTISGNFQFTVSSLVSSIGVSGSPPQVQSTTVISPNLIKVIFNQQFTVGRQFRLTISNILNPLDISTGAISLYSMPYNSITPLEVTELTIPYQTVSYTPTLTLYTAEGISALAPMEFYMDTVQYITLTILLPRVLDPTFIVQVASDALYFQEGTVYLKTSTVNSNTLVYSHPDSQTLQVSGFSGTIPSGSLLTVTFSAWIGASPIFNIYVSIDTAAHIAASAPIIYGTTSATVSGLPENFISALTGSGGETNKITAMQSATSSISFSVTPLFTTYAGSFLEIYTSRHVVADATFNGASSCLVNGSAQPCSVTTNSEKTVVRIASNSSFNLYPQSQTTAIQIDQLKFNYASSHSSYIYHFYFQLTVSLASLASVAKYLAVPMVVQERNQMPGFGIYFSNDIYNSGANFVNVIRLVSQTPAEWTNVVQANERRIISLFAYQGWKNLFTTLASYSSYECASNLAATYQYIQGSNSQNLTSEYPLNWDRIHITLPGTESSTKFSIILPTLYPANAPYLFEIMVGIVDVNNGAITYLHSGPMPAVGATTYLTPANILVYSKPKQTAMQLNIAGLAGSYDSNVSFTVAPSASFNGNGYSTALIVMSSWQFFDPTTALHNTSLNSADPQFANVEQTPLFIKISSSSFLTYIPFKTTGVHASNFDIIFDNIKFPYSLDLPYHSVSLIDAQGALDGYNQFINQNQNIFYTGVMQAFTVNCNDNSLGVTSTFCDLEFTTFQDIEVGSVMVANLFGMFVSTNLCSMKYSGNSTTVPILSCLPNNNLNVLTITLGNTARLPALTSYSITVNGISIDAAQMSNYITLDFKDPTNAYAIEKRTRILLTSAAHDFAIFITQVNFAKNNPIVPSSLFLNFTLPRSLNADQAFALVLSKDFITLNNIPSKIRIRLMQSDGVTEIATTWVMKSISSQIIFQNLQSVLTATSYSLEIYGIQTPSTVTQDMVAVIYLRIYDNTFAKSNTPASTAVFPSLTSKADSLITLQTYFNTEGLEHELLFTVVNQYVPITQYTVWVINLPIYYSKVIWNQDYLMYCTISGTPLTCQRSQYTPYQIVVSASPLLVSVGPAVTYTISVFGVPCPRATYLNGNAMFATESIFFGMYENENATAYTDYSNLFLSNTVINPQTAAGYGSIVLKSVTSSNMQVYQTTFFTINVVCSVSVPSGSWVFITFPQLFDNFNNIPMVVQTQYAVGSYEVSTSSQVINTRVGYQLNSLTIPAHTQFQIMITSLLTPKTATSVDMNSMKVLIAAADRISTIATSLQSRNELGSLTFIPNTLHLTVNNYSPIQLTAGTYSNPIRINPSDNSTFLTNMQITFSSTQFSFDPNPTFLYLGNSFSTFTMGAGQNVIPTTYTFNLAKKETAISALYSTLSEYAVRVTSVPITIAFPTSFSVPLGGCSMPVAVELTNPPFSYITVYYEYNTSQVLASEFWVNQEISFDQMEFDINNTKRWVSFCSLSTFAASSFVVDLNLGGDNSASFVFSQSTTTINILPNASLTSAPTFNISASNVQKTFAAIQVDTNVPGFFFYQLKISPIATQLTFSDIQTYVKTNNMTLESSSDYLSTKIYTLDRDHRVGYTPILVAGTNSVSLQNLLPQRSYTLCAYFENQFSEVSASKCLDFTMQSWGVVSKAYVQFSAPILANQLNNLLCFFVKASNSEINQIVDLEGSSCSLNTSPQNYAYSFIGNSTTHEYSKTVIYHTPNVNLTTDPSISAFNSLFDSTGISTASLATAQTDFSINFISTSYFMATFDPMDGIQSLTADFQPQIAFTTNAYQTGSYKISVTNLISSVPGTVYFVLVSYKNITTNQISSTTTITIKPVVVPTADQIASCVDGSGHAGVQCRRVVMLNSTAYNFDFQFLVENSVYAVHYVYANQFPQRPIFYGNVMTSYLFTTSHEHFLACLSLALLLLLALIL